MNRTKTNPLKMNPLKQMREKEPDFSEESNTMYDDDSIGAAIDRAFDNVILALNELREIVRQL